MSGDPQLATHAADKIVEALEACILRVCAANGFSPTETSLGVLHAYVDGMTDDHEVADAVIKSVQAAQRPEPTDEQLIDGYEPDNDEDETEPSA